MDKTPIQRPASTSDARKRKAERDADQTDPAEPTVHVQVCSICRRERTLHDVNDYTPMQAITGAPLGWYSGDDGEICPEDMEQMMRGHLS